jgi:hypothetical protein
MSDYKDKEIQYENAVKRLLDSNPSDIGEATVLRDWLMVRNLCGIADTLSSIENILDNLQSNCSSIMGISDTHTTNVADGLDEIRIAIKSLKVKNDE